MHFPSEWTLLPLEGASRLRFGMSLAEVEGIIGQPDQALAKVWGSEARRAGWLGGALALHFSPSLAFIEFSRRPGIDPMIFGKRVFDTPAADLVAAMVEAGHLFDPTDPELGHSYTFKDIQIGLWRPVVPEDEQDTEGRYFQTIGLAQNVLVRGVIST